MLLVLHILSADIHHLLQDRVPFHQPGVSHLALALQILEILQTKYNEAQHAAVGVTQQQALGLGLGFAAAASHLQGGE